MKDRIPTYPGRVKLNPVDGQANTFDMVRADEPEQEGTPLNKASLLTDETAALFGLGEDATVDDALANTQRKFPVGTVISSSQPDAPDKLGGVWALCNGSYAKAADTPELYYGESGLTKYVYELSEDGTSIIGESIVNSGLYAIFGHGCYADGYYVVPFKGTSSYSNTNFGITYFSDLFGAWKAHPIEGTGITLVDSSSGTSVVVSFCSGRWFMSCMNYISANVYELHLLTTTDLSGEWTNLPVMGGATFPTSATTNSRVYETESAYVFVSLATFLSSTYKLYLICIDKETLEATVSTLWADTITNGTYDRLLSVNFLDGVLYATMRFQKGSYYTYILKIDPEQKNFTIVCNRLGYSTDHPTNVMKWGNKYIFLYGTGGGETAFTNSVQRYWYPYISEDGENFSQNGSSVSFSGQLVYYSDLIEVDGKLYLSVSGSVYPIDENTFLPDTASVVTLSGVLRSYGKSYWSYANSSGYYGSLLVSPEAIVMVYGTSSGSTVYAYYLTADAVKLPEISLDSAYTYIKLREK